MNTEIEEDNIVQPPHYREGGPPQIVTPDTARQGPPGKRVLTVLVVSLIGAVIAIAFAVMIWGHGR